MPDLNNRFSGAWLTDIDDTLLRSGHYPDDVWIQSLADFIRRLKAHNIVWAPVSGVAINKMGARLLFRLPKDVLSHVVYYGGEGGVKSYYDAAHDKWHSPKDFQRNFSDMQALVLIGEQRFADALAIQYAIDKGGEKKLSCEEIANRDSEIQQRITSATTELRASRYCDIPCLVEQMEIELKNAGFDPGKAETYFRGGAISWMMFGDVSVKNYKGEKETSTRYDINQFIKNKLLEYDYLKDIGEDGVHMPYLHATRGIKLVLMGNDKARAADDLVNKEAIDVSSLLFVGNELFEGGNDDPVRRVQRLTILSVGEKEDPGVIDGGVQVEANRQWMDALTEMLDNGSSWPIVLQSLANLALSLRVRQSINLEKTHAHNISEWHDQTGKKIPTDLLLDLCLKYGDAFKSTRSCLLKLKYSQYELVTRLSVLKRYHYDNARKIVMDILGNNPAEAEKEDIKRKIKESLLPEICGLLKLLLIDHLGLSGKSVANAFDDVTNLEGLQKTVRQLIESSNIQEHELELDRKSKLINNWSTSIEELVDAYFIYLNEWKLKLTKQSDLVRSDATVIAAKHDVSEDELYKYFRWLISRVDNYPHLKDLDKPTIILVAGTSGVGKSTISRHVSKTMGIPTAFSSDVASRSVVRETISFLLGCERAEQLFPEVIGSSFEENNLDWFYAHSLMTMVGVVGNINRLIKENISAVIDGVALIPGTLPEIIFEKANIVWIVACVADREVHFERLGTRSETGVERGGAERYREQFTAIRRNHDRLVEMAMKTHTLTVDNSDAIEKVFQTVLDRVNNPIADRGLYIDDEVREKVRHRLHERATWDIQNILQDI